MLCEKYKGKKNCLSPFHELHSPTLAGKQLHSADLYALTDDGQISAFWKPNDVKFTNDNDRKFKQALENEWRENEMIAESKKITQN